MRIVLVWMLFPGIWAVSGPSQVTAHWGSSLSVSCSYQQGYKLHSKVWCKTYFFKIFCTYMAQTNGSEAAVTQGRVSIRDNHTALAFTVTMRDVTAKDTGWYSCGAVKSLWNNQWHKTEPQLRPAMCAHWQRQPRPPLALKSLQRCPSSTSPSCCSSSV